MARIPSSRAPAGPIRQQALPAAGTEFRGGVVDAGSVGRGLQSLGAGLGAAAGAVANLQTRQEAVDDRASDFEVQRRFVEFQTQQNQRARDLQQNVAPGAFGYTQQVQKDYKEKADGFARTIPDRLRPEYDAKLAGLEGKFILNSDGFEREQRQAFYVDGIGTGFDELRESVIRGDVPYEQALQEGANLVDASGLTQFEKQKFMQSWRKDAAAALWRNEYEKDPAKALVAIGGGTPAQRQEYQVDRLRAAVMQQESGGDPNAVSPVGATGLMQVMPATGRDIAKQLGDGSFPANGTIAEQQAYLKRPEVSIRYGNFYLDQQLDKFGGDVEAALIAYNAGPGNAQKWLKAGRDYAALPKRSETEPYVRKIMGGLSGSAVDRQQFGQQEVGAGDFRSQFYTWADFRNDRFRDAKMDQAAVGALDQVTAAFGKGPLRITSGFRTTEHNAKASFTKDSRHTHGDAFDIDVSGYSPEEKAQLVSMFIASGARGLGHYTEGGAAGTIHVDFRQGKGKGPGGLALWLNQNKPYANGETWFSDGVNQGLAREGLTFSRNGPADPRFDALDYKSRQQLIGEAQRRVNQNQAAAKDQIIGDFQLQMETDPLGVTEDQILGATGIDNGDKAALLSRLDAEVGAAASQRADEIKLEMTENPRGVKEKDILDEPLLDDGQKASLVTQLRAATKKFNEAQLGAQLYADGVQGNALDKDDRKLTDEGWESFKIQPDNEKYAPMALSFVQRRGMLPGAVVNEVRGAVIQGDPEKAFPLLELGSAAAALNPQALVGRDGSADLRDAVAEYDYFRKLGFSEAEAAQKVIQARQPGQEVAQLPADIRKKIQGISADDVENLYDETFTDLFATDPALGANISAQTITREYQDLVTEQYQRTGDLDTARARAEEQMKRTYNVSNATGDPIIMRHPPESYYPAVNGSHDYLGTQLKSGVTEAFGEDVEGYNLTPVPGVTDVDVRTGKPPRYGVIVERKDGTFDVLPEGVFFQPDVPKAEVQAVETREKEIQTRSRQIEQAALDGDGLVIGANDVLISVITDDAKHAEPFPEEEKDQTFAPDYTVTVNPKTKEIYVRDEETGEFEPTGDIYPDRIMVQTSGQIYNESRSPDAAQRRQEQFDQFDERQRQKLQGMLDYQQMMGAPLGQ